jgi:hypothetical protein
MSKKRKPNAEKTKKKRDKKTEKSAGEFSAFLDQMRQFRIW